jgi:hypothetical protein
MFNFYLRFSDCLLLEPDSRCPHCGGVEPCIPAQPLEDGGYKKEEKSKLKNI